jgi:hypothetical protein
MRYLSILTIAAGSAVLPLKAANVWSLTLTSANGGADTLFSWNYTGTISQTRTQATGIQSAYPWAGKALGGLVTVAGPSEEAYAGFDPLYTGENIILASGLGTGLAFTNTSTSQSMVIDRLIMSPQWGQFYLGWYQLDQLQQNIGETVVLSGPSTGSFLSGVAFSDFNEGQWIFNLPDANYSYDAVLTVAGTPEPTSALMSALGATMLLRRRK